MAKPVSKGEARHKACSPRRGKRAYYPGNKPFMKRKAAKARRRTAKSGNIADYPYAWTWTDL